jgi:two-component system, NtrC family, sensor kinase
MTRTLSIDPESGLHVTASSAARPNVLIVDDIEANLVALEALLENLSCEVIRAKSGNEALRQLLKREYAVILLDVQMPGMDGYEVALHARQNPSTREIPIIFLTATHNTEDNVLRGYGSGAVDFLFKPLNSAILRSKVRVFLELYAGRRQIADSKLALERSNVELHALAEAKAALADRFQRANENLGQAYQELQDTQALLVQSAKMASLGELVAGVAHEVNNPLAFVLSHLETVKRSLEVVHAETCGALTEPAAEHWKRARSRLGEMGLGLERIRDLVVKLRTFSRLDEGEKKQVSVRECVDSVVTILGHRLKDRIVIETDCGEPDSLECYPGLLNQAIMNLVANAIDAIEGKGRITITTGLSGSMYAIKVVDDGPGIPEHLKERVLEPFFTTKPVGQGTGLGLSISYSIVKKHEGTLELSDAPGGGTAAIIELPISSDKETKHASAR